MKENKLISIVVPVYRGEPFLVDLYERVKNALLSQKCTFEIILVNDQSPDDSWEIIQNLANNTEEVIGVNLSRNFGQHAAITAGLSEAKGEIVIVMDCDLQDVPEEIPKLISKIEEGFDVVFARRVERNDSFFKRLFSKWFYKILSYLTGIKMDHTIANYGAYRIEVIQAILSMGDYVRYLPTMVKWVGFKATSVEVQHDARSVGKSSYNLRGLIRLGINVVITFSDKPLRLMVNIGLFISVGSFLLAILYAILYFMEKIEVTGYASLIISIWFVGGVVITFLGLIGSYLGKLFDQTKRRPVFIVKEKLNAKS
ncbi:MAG: glycosyltransferase family 2 protein [Crocinitomicaceae bacterium]